MYKTSLVIRTQFEGIHRYPTAPDEVGYLRHPHRHFFHVEVRLKVGDKDREEEFIMVKHFIDVQIIRVLGPPNLGVASCELMCDKLMRAVAKKFSSVYLVSVFEDGENGAILERT